MTTTEKPYVISPNDCVWDAHGEWESAYYGSVQDARDRTRGQAAANFSREVGEAIVNLSTWKRWIKLFTYQDIWDGPGRDRWFDDWMEREGIDMRYLEDTHEWIYINADTGERVEAPEIPDSPPEGWEPAEYDPAWEFVKKDTEGAIPVWICGFKGDDAP